MPKFKVIYKQVRIASYPGYVIVDADDESHAEQLADKFSFDGDIEFSETPSYESVDFEEIERVEQIKD